MRKIIGVSIAAIATLMTLVPVVMPADLTALVSVQTSCDVAATGPVDFGQLNPGDTSADKTSTVYEPIGNAGPLAVTMFGTDWTNAGPTMPVNQTHWSLSPGQNYTTQMNQLHLSPGDSLGGTIGPAQNQTVNFKLQIPAHQAAVSYTQTITFSVGC